MRDLAQGQHFLSELELDLPTLFFSPIKFGRGGKREERRSGFVPGGLGTAASLKINLHKNSGVDFCGFLPFFLFYHPRHSSPSYECRAFVITFTGGGLVVRGRVVVCRFRWKCFLLRFVRGGEGKRHVLECGRAAAAPRFNRSLAGDAKNPKRNSHGIRLLVSSSRSSTLLCETCRVTCFQ